VIFETKDNTKEEVNLSEECAAVCSQCGEETTGKIYEPYWCADCKIKNLEEEVQCYKDQYNYAEKERTEWIKKFNDESIQKTKYRCAFEALFEKVSQK
jgi:tRNA G26 N,N-dimethylase Trm1